MNEGVITVPTVTIGFVPRERFSLAAESLQRIFDYTHIPFNLIVVDCNIPKVYWQQMEQVLQGRDNVKIIHRDHYLLPNQSKNLVIQEAQDEYLCLIENDNLVQDRWLSQLIAACEEYPADVAVPLLMEGPLGAGKVHFDDLLGQVRTVHTTDGVKWEIQPRTDRKEQERGCSERRAVQFMEQHCLLFRRSVFDRIGPYDEELNTRDEIDLSLALYKAGVRVVFEPKCEIHYIPPYPPRPDETDYFFMKWDLERAAKSRNHIQKKWNLVHVPGDMEFVKDRNRIGQLHRVKEELRTLVPADEPFILVDQAQWLGTKIVEGLHPLPFLERDGQYWGEPVDDDTAIRELERLRQSGASRIAFGWHTFWWFEYYSKFHHYLRSQFPCMLENDRLIVFDLKGESQNTRPIGEATPARAVRPGARCSEPQVGRAGAGISRSLGHYGS
jgi:hypothetical protein